jgi:large subunit ribosomal protein L13
MKTKFHNEKQLNDSRAWILVDATDKTVGRLASRIAYRLRGKANPNYNAHIDAGDFVVVINADKMKFTGQKNEKKLYYKHTGFIGNLKTYVAGELMKKKPEELLFKTVEGMLPAGPLAKAQMTKLKVYTGTDHPHAAQNPQPIELV